jgi:hypothetical protein
MATPTEINTATLYASSPTTSSSTGTSFSGLSFSCEGIPLLKSNGAKHLKDPAASRNKVIFARIEQSWMPSEIDFNGIVKWIVGSFQKSRIHLAVRGI